MHSIIFKQYILFLVVLMEMAFRFGILIQSESPLFLIKNFNPFTFIVNY